MINIKTFLLILVLTSIGAGCSKKNKQDSSVAPVQKSSSSLKERVVLPDGVSRIVAIGDLHGDFEATKKVFQLVGAIDENENWIGKNLVVVQTGDFLDRGKDELKIVNFLRKLIPKAKKAGGAVHILLGNHEILNIRGVVEYSDDSSLKDFEKFVSNNKSKSKFENLPENHRGKAIAFAPGGPLSQFLSKSRIIMILGDTLFVHGGVLLSHINYGIEKINKETSSWIKGEVPKMPKIIKGRKAPTWVRKFSKKRMGEKKCRKLEKVLKKAGVNRLVVGHTIQKHGITSACLGKIWRIDVGLSSVYKSGLIQALEITKNGVKVLGK
jgi:Calcineurin-like phosphoesterase